MPPITSLAPFSAHRLAVEREDGQRQLAVGREELALDDVVGAHRLDDGVVLGPVGQVVGHDRRRIARRVRLAARRQHGDEAVDAVGQLQVDDGAAEGLELRLLQEVLALHHHQHVVLAGGKAAVDLLVAAELLGVGAEQLGERIVDAQQEQAPDRERGDQHDERKGDGRRPQSDETELLQPERKGPLRCVHAGVHSPPRRHGSLRRISLGMVTRPRPRAQAAPQAQAGAQASGGKSLPRLCIR